MKCPKCSTEASDAARFCPRCHATLLYQCPSCSHEQRQGGVCEKCGVNFVKYLSVMVSSKKAEADAAHERIRRRSSTWKTIISIFLTGGLSLLRPSAHRRDK